MNKRTNPFSKFFFLFLLKIFLLQFVVELRKVSKKDRAGRRSGKGYGTCPLPRVFLDDPTSFVIVAESPQETEENKLLEVEFCYEKISNSWSNPEHQGELLKQGAGKKQTNKQTTTPQ
jgi:hypothetical protein